MSDGAAVAKMMRLPSLRAVAIISSTSFLYGSEPTESSTRSAIIRFRFAFPLRSQNGKAAIESGDFLMSSITDS